MYKNKVYLAGPFFSELQIERIKKTKQLLINNETIASEHIFVPMEQDKHAQYEFGTLPWQRETFNMDTRHIKQADVMVAVLDYEYTKDGVSISDPGTIFEIGMAFEAGIPVVLVQYDKVDTLNLMLSESYVRFFNGEENVNNLADYDFNKLISYHEDLGVI